MALRASARAIFNLTLLLSLAMLLGCAQPQLQPEKAGTGKAAGKAAAKPAPVVPVGPARLEGTWEGILAEKLKLVVNISKTSDGSYTGVIDSVNQQGATFPIDSITFDANRGTLRFSVSKVGAIYEGTFSNDRSQIAGNWAQGGSTLKLAFVRTR
jgi:hypothetical protein